MGGDPRRLPRLDPQETRCLQEMGVELRERRGRAKVKKTAKTETGAVEKNMRKICNRSTAVSAGRRGGTRNTKKIRGKKKRVAITAETGQLRTNKTRERKEEGEREEENKR